MPAHDRALPTDVLVVGAGLAATSTAAALRRGGFTGTLRVLGDEGTAPYDRPPLSKHLLDRPAPAWLADELGMDLAGLVDDLRLAEPALDLDLTGPRPAVRTERGWYVADDVVLATGSRPVVPAGWSGVRTLRTHEDATGLRAALGTHARLVVIGAGWVGAEVAGVAARAGHDVVVVEQAPNPLNAALGAVGARTARWYTDAGVRLINGTVREVDADGLRLRDGTAVGADVVLAAVGVRPAADWLRPVLALRPDGSVTVDGSGRVLASADPDGPPLPGVWAVGDVATRRSARHGWVGGGHWDGALRGPQTLADALLGTGGEVRDPAPYVFSTQLGHDLALFGLPGADDDVLLRERADGWTALWLAGDQVRAILVVDTPREVSAARRLMSGPQLPRVDRDEAADPERPLSARSAGSR